MVMMHYNDIIKKFVEMVYLFFGTFLQALGENGIELRSSGG